MSGFHSGLLSWPSTYRQVESQTLRCHCCLGSYIARKFTNGPANLLVFVSYMSNKNVSGLCFTLADKYDPDTVSIVSLSEDVIILISLKQEVLTSVSNLVAVAIHFFFSRKTAASWHLLCHHYKDHS